MDSDNRRSLKAMGVVVCLVTSLETIRERVSSASSPLRPLAGDPEALAALFDQRMAAYKQADVMVETDGLSVEQAAQRVLRAVGPRLKSEEA